MSHQQSGKLYVCATPIGNLEDVTLRVLRTLKEVDLIAAEDTRRTRKLLSHYDIKAKLISFHKFSPPEKKTQIVDQILSGKKIALVSDAGLPGISDPGHDLIQACIENSVDIEVLPGPSALLSALVISGLPTDRFLFVGFVPRTSARRKKFLGELVDEAGTLVLFEAPHRIRKLLQDLLGILGDRRIAIVRELTKVHEEILRGRAGEMIQVFQEREPRGEFVVIVEGKREENISTLQDQEIVEKVKEMEDRGMFTRKAIEQVAMRYNISKNRVYDLVVEDRRGG